MKIHVFRSEEVSKSIIRTIADIIGKYREPVKFIFREEDLMAEPEDMAIPLNGGRKEGGKEPDHAMVTRSVMTWAELFGICEEIRNSEEINADEGIVLLTGHDNERNWFSSWDETGRLNFFIQTTRWEDVTSLEACYPIAYELATIPLYFTVCSNIHEAEAMAHIEPRGCIFDYCIDKRQAILRLRTGDICSDCQRKMVEKGIDHAMARQVFGILETIRSRIVFSNRFGITGRITRLNIDRPNQTLVFSNDSGRTEVYFDNRLITVYLFFMNHPEGIFLKNMRDHEREIAVLYRNFCGDPNETEVTNTISNMVDHGLSNTLNELLSKIKSKLNFVLREEIACDFIVAGTKGNRFSIPADRSIVTINGQPFRQSPRGLI